MSGRATMNPPMMTAVMATSRGKRINMGATFSFSPRKTKAKKKPPIKIELLWVQTNATPGGTEAWKPSRIPMAIRPQAIQKEWLAPSLFFSSRRMSVARERAANVPSASMVE